MTRCAVCGSSLLADGTCPSCSRGHDSKGVAELPLITWDEVEQFLIRRLMMDDDWTTRAEGVLTWYPWFLPQKTYVQAEGRYGDWTPDNWLTVRSVVEIAAMPKPLGVGIACELNKDFHLGVFIYSDGILSVQSSLKLNPLSRSLLSLFHNQVLAQVTIAHQVALELIEDGDVVLLEKSHPVSGARTEPDELLNFYRHELSPELIPDDFLPALHEARSKHLKDSMTQMGWTIGLDNDEVTFFESRHVWAGVGIIDDGFDWKRFGPGLTIHAIPALQNSGFRLDAEGANELNLLVAQSGEFSQFGSFQAVGEGSPEGSASSLVSYLPMAFLAESRENPREMSIAINNGTVHASSAVQILWPESADAE